MKTATYSIALSLLLVPTVALADWHDKARCYDGPSRTRYQYHGNSGFGHSNYGNYGNHGYGYSNFGRNSYRSNYNSPYDGAIWNGIRTGRLSNDEVRELREDQRELREKEIAYRSDGRLTQRERNDLRDEYNDYKKDLNHELNDGEKRRSYSRGFDSWRWPW